MQNQPSANEEALRSAPFGQLARKLCIPAILIMLVTVIYHMADVLFISKTGDPNKVAAVSLASPVFTVLSGLGVLLGTGGCTAVSLALGKGERDKVRAYSALCIYGSVAVGLAFGAAVLAFLPVICSWLGTDEATLGFTMDYLRVIALGAPVILFCNVVPSLVRADGSTVNSMIGNMIGTVGNLVLDPILILALNWGVTGAAIATVLGNVFSMVYFIWFITHKGRTYAAAPKHISLRGEILKPVFTLGLPMSVSTILSSISGAVCNNLMIQYGAVAVSASSVASRVGMIISMTVMGICIGMQPAISYNYSANHRKRLTEILWKTCALAFAVGTALALVCLIFRDQVISIFLSDPEVLRIGRVCLLASVIIGPVYGFYQLSTTYLQATGKAKKAIIVSLLEKGLIYIPLLFIAHALFGLYGVIFSGTVTTVLSMAVSLYFCYHIYRKELSEGEYV